MRIGDSYCLTFLVDAPLYNGFVQLFKDKNPLHMDDSVAISKGFKEKVMHGNILNGFLSFFIGEALPDKDVMILSQEISYMNPVYLNDSLKLNAIITDVIESVRVIEIKFSFENQDKLKIARGKIQIQQK